MKGYKGFDKELRCRGFQYEVGKEYTYEGKIELCNNGFHFCNKISDVNDYYKINQTENRFCEVEAKGQIIEGEDKCVTNKIKIIRELTIQEVYELANEGKSNIGVGNTGDWNTGDWNTGDWNTGDWNTRDYNTGNRNTGNCNTGYYNTGNRNTGNRNTGNCNTGDCNTGDWNTGGYNTGYYNTGDWNTGEWNTGDCNTGNCNTGYYNTGNRNTGNRNTGDWNTGDWNKTNRSSGVFCNKEPKLIIFNKETDMTWEEWRNSEAYDILNRHAKSKWIWYDDMTKKEKEENKSAKTCDGYLKEIERKVGSKEWWNSLEMYEKATIVQLPNFALDIFNDIMEFRVTKKEYNEILSYLKIEDNKRK